MYHPPQGMSQDRAKQVETILGAMRMHPRIVHQGLAASTEQLQLLRTTMPFFVPFETPQYAGFIPVLDWDHKLPSRVAILRLYGYYTEATLRAGESEFTSRSDQIKLKDEFPEFDVPDFVGLSADEAYEGEVEPGGKVLQLRLVSPWRRDINHGDSRLAVQVARRSEEFRLISAKPRKRPDYLGDLEAVSWTPPCESAYGKWTIDVWYLMDLDAAMGKGRSFLVDLKLKQVVGVREFVVRSG